jgi:hypothetical protein
VQTKSFSDFTARYAGLVGIPWDSQTSTEQEWAKGYLQTAIQDSWESNSFLDICPYGEARFISNLVPYPTKLANPAWSASAVTVTDNATNNPVDGFETCAAIRETAVDSTHRLIASVTGLIGSTSYCASCFARPVNRQYIYLTILNGALTAQVIVDLFAGTAATPSGTFSNMAANASQSSDGFYFVELNFTTTTAISASTTLRVGVSNSASVLQYVGNVDSGADIWGVCLTPTSNLGLNNSLLPFEQTGFDPIGTVLEVWWQSPVGFLYPVKAGYQITRAGIQFINSGPYCFYPYWGFPVPALGNATGTSIPNIAFLNYRKQVAELSGDDYDASSTYAVGDQVLFDDSEGISDYYKCVAATTAGQSPEGAPTYWEVIPIPAVLFIHAVYSSYANWLLQDGQVEKSLAMDSRAQLELDKQSDVQERQMGLVPPMRVATHVTSQPRSFY